MISPKHAIQQFETIPRSRIPNGLKPLWASVILIFEIVSSFDIRIPDFSYFKYTTLGGPQHIVEGAREQKGELIAAETDDVPVADLDRLVLQPHPVQQRSVG